MTVTVRSLELEQVLSASGCMMWNAMAQSRGLLTAAMPVSVLTSVATRKLLELFVPMVSWDGMSPVYTYKLCIFLMIH